MGVSTLRTVQTSSLPPQSKHDIYTSKGRYLSQDKHCDNGNRLYANLLNLMKVMGRQHWNKVNGAQSMTEVAQSQMSDDLHVHCDHRGTPFVQHSQMPT